MSTFDGFANFNHSLIIGLACAEKGPKLFGSNCTASGKLLAHFDESEQPLLSSFVVIEVDVVQMADSASLRIGDQGLTWTGCAAPNLRSVVDSVVIYGAGEAFDVTLGADDVAVADENVDYDPDLMRLQMNELELDWCDAKKLSLKWSVKT